MGKLSDLKKLVDEARAKVPPARPAPSPTTQRVPSPRRAVAAAKHADGDIDLGAAFADVRKLPASTRIPHAPARPAPIPQQRINDAADALEASKYGAEPAPQAWDIGQEHEAHQTFLRRGLPTDILTKLWRVIVRRGDDLHGHRTDEAHDALADFLDSAPSRLPLRARDPRQGLTSPNREPVLKGKVRRWPRTGTTRSRIAKREDGRGESKIQQAAELRADYGRFRRSPRR
jgi:DNA-nicking Smr family endonuclease